MVNGFTQASLSRFLRDDDGAVTVDWVVLTALVIALALVVWTAVLVPIGGVTAQQLAYQISGAVAKASGSDDD